MEFLFDIFKDCLGGLLSSILAKVAPPTARFCEPYITTATAKSHAHLSALWSDCKRSADNPLGLLWLLSGFSILAIAVWASINPATAPVALWLPLTTVVCGFLVAFGLCGAKALAPRLTGRG